MKAGNISVKVLFMVCVLFSSSSYSFNLFTEIKNVIDVIYEEIIKPVGEGVEKEVIPFFEDPFEQLKIKDELNDALGFMTSTFPADNLSPENIINHIVKADYEQAFKDYGKDLEGVGKFMVEEALKPLGEEIVEYGMVVYDELYLEKVKEFGEDSWDMVDQLPPEVKIFIDSFNPFDFVIFANDVEQLFQECVDGVLDTLQESIDGGEFEFSGMESVAEGVVICNEEAVANVVAVLENMQFLADMLAFFDKLLKGESAVELEEWQASLDRFGWVYASSMIRTLGIDMGIDKDFYSDVGISEYDSIDGVRTSDEVNFNANYSSTLSYVDGEKSACAIVSLPGVCEGGQAAAETVLSKFDYKAQGISVKDMVERRKNLLALSNHAFGSSLYMPDIVYDLLFSPEFEFYRTPYLAPTQLISGNQGMFLYDADDSIIILNDDNLYGVEFEEDRAAVASLYLEELGHFIEKWRCKVVGIGYDSCDSIGDAGARFSEAVLLDGYDFVNAVADLPLYEVDYDFELTFANGNKAYYETMPSMVVMQTHLARQGWTFRYRLRGQLGWETTGVLRSAKTSGYDATAGLGSNLLLEFRYTPPRLEEDAWSRYYDSSCPEQLGCDLHVGKLQVRFADETFVGGGVEWKALEGYSEAGLDRAYSFHLPLVKSSRVIAEKYDPDIMKAGTRFGLETGGYTFSYAALHIPVIDDLLKGYFTNAVYVTWGGPYTSWPVSDTGAIAFAMGTSQIGAVSGCLGGAFIARGQKEALSACDAGSQLGQQLIAFGIAALQGQEVRADAGYIISTRIQQHNRTGTFNLSKTGLNSSRGWGWGETGSAARVELRLELVRTTEDVQIFN